MFLAPDRISPLQSADFAFDERNCVADRDETLRVAVSDVDVEVLLKRHDDLIEVDAVSPKVGELWRGHRMQFSQDIHCCCPLGRFERITAEQASGVLASAKIVMWRPASENFAAL
jgi:hypothetical protein